MGAEVAGMQKSFQTEQAFLTMQISIEKQTTNFVNLYWSSVTANQTLNGCAQLQTVSVTLGFDIIEAVTLWLARHEKFWCCAATTI